MGKKVMVMASVLLVLAMGTIACRSGAPAPRPTATPRVATPTPLPATATPTVVPESKPTPTAAVDPVALGKSLAAQNGCTACHSIDGSASLGPTWKGLYGREETLVDGSKVMVDDAYLHESIVDPDAKIVKGFSAGIMPKDFGEKLSEDEIMAIIEYIKTVK